jgi:hypothetical protein
LANDDDMLRPRSFSIEPLRRDGITAISRVVERRPIVLVLGMHRSGTSLCSHLLSALGVDMADNISGPGNPAPTPDNPRGHWERWEIVEFHDRILRLFNRDYLGRFHDFALPVAWWADPRVAQIRHEMIAFLENRMGDGYFGFKDPRTVRLMPVWHQIFNELKLAPKLVLCLRDPAQVARSLHARDGLDPAIGEYRWLVHLIDFFRFVNSYDFCTVEYEGWFGNPSANLEKLRKFLDLPWQQSESDLALVLSGIIDPALRHDDSQHRKANHPLVRSLYEIISRADQDADAEAQIAYIVSQFVGFQQLQKPFQQAFEEVAKVAAQFAEAGQERVALRAAVRERDAVVEAADAKSAAAEGRLGAALAEIEEQRAQIADLVKRRDERETALANISRRVDELVAVREAALAEAERAEQQQTALAEAMQTEIAALWDSLEQLHEEARQREAATLVLRGRLAQAEAEATERAATTAAWQGEIAALRGRLAQAEGDARERAAKDAGLQAEVAALQDALNAARQVGKVIAASRSDAAAPIEPMPRGWRQAIARFFGAETTF